MARLTILRASRWDHPRDPGAARRDDAIFLGESLLQELKSPWELILTEPVPEVVEFQKKKKKFNEAEEIASLDMGARNQFSWKRIGS